MRRQWQSSGVLGAVAEPACDSHADANHTSDAHGPAAAAAPPSEQQTAAHASEQQTAPAHAGLRPHRWCIVTTDDRPRVPLSTYWALQAAINEVYSYAHGYGFVFLQQASGSDLSSLSLRLRYPYLSPRLILLSQVSGSDSDGAAAQRDGGGRVDAVAQVLLHGAPPLGRACQCISRRSSSDQLRPAMSPRFSAC